MSGRQTGSSEPLVLRFLGAVSRAASWAADAVSCTAFVLTLAAFAASRGAGLVRRDTHWALFLPRWGLANGSDGERYDRGRPGRYFGRFAG